MDKRIIHFVENVTTIVKRDGDWYFYVNQGDDPRYVDALKEKFDLQEEDNDLVDDKSLKWFYVTKKK